MKYRIVTVLLMAAALPLYVAGFGMGGSVALAAAILLEGVFWMRIVRGRSRLTSQND